ncbi:MAG: hypothetical protein PUP92_16265 [Rhizonema sp. PD38]|nr:hypothetical protein [Rhizonema sp. PD38]
MDLVSPTFGAACFESVMSDVNFADRDRSSITPFLDLGTEGAIARVLAEKFFIFVAVVYLDIFVAWKKG